jgi:hypothetical protein
VSIPKKHHYLPESYLKRWAQNGEVVSYVRPQGSDGKLHFAMKPPAAVGYEPYLYELPDIKDPKDRQSVELDLLQSVDSKAATALNRLDQGETLTDEEHGALCQFVKSLVHRTPERLKALREDLAKRTEGAPFAGLTGREFDDKLKATNNRLLSLLVDAPDELSMFPTFKADRIVVNGATKKLLTSDRPMIASAQIMAHDAFILMPYAPDCLIILTHRKSIITTISNETNKYPNIFVSNINKAIVEQAETIVIASNNQATRMIEKRFCARSLVALPVLLDL